MVMCRSCTDLAERLDLLRTVVVHAPLRRREDGVWCAQVPVGAFLMALSTAPTIGADERPASGVVE